jgi:NADH dehydrogenase
LNLASRPYEQARYVTCVDLGPWGAVFSTGWERQVELIKAEAKARKQFVMTEVIYPPMNDRAAILEAGALA